MQSTSWETLGWMKHKLESRLPGEISITSDMQTTLPLWQQVKNWRTSWWKWKKTNFFSTFRKDHGIWFHHFMANRWGNTGWLYFFFGSKITADDDCSNEIKWRLLLRRKSMTNLDSILTSRDITLPTKVCLVKAMVFPVVMYGCESWTKRKLSTEELMLLNCGVGEDSWESLGLQGDPTSPA